MPVSFFVTPERGLPYQLDKDEQWGEITGDRSVAYSGLRDGHYQFSVEALTGMTPKVQPLHHLTL